MRRHDDGTTERERLEAAGVSVDAGAPEYPEFSFLLDWWTELAAARPAGMGATPISFTEIAAWSTLTGRRIAPADVALLRRIDDIFIRTMTAK